MLFLELKNVKTYAKVCKPSYIQVSSFNKTKKRVLIKQTVV
jgi:hypothetical protein